MRIRLGYYLSFDGPRGKSELGTKDIEEAIDIAWGESESTSQLVYLWQRTPEHWDLIGVWKEGVELQLAEAPHPGPPELTPDLIGEIAEARDARLIQFPYKPAPQLVRRKRQKMLWRSGATVTNKKVGPVPTSYVGTTEEESLLSCLGCGLLPAKFGGPGDPEKKHGACYAWIGQTGNAALKHIQRISEQDPHRYSFEYAMDHRSDLAKMLRLGAIGDPARAFRRELAKVYQYAVDFNLWVMGYTHHWRDPEAQDLKDRFLASTNSPEEADLAISMGWTPTTVLPWYFTDKMFVTPGGGRGLICPAQISPDLTGLGPERRKQGKIASGAYVGITCNNCGMCDIRHPVWKSIDVIGFLEHGTKITQEMKRFGFRQHPISRKPDTRPPRLLPIIDDLLI